jgi:polyphosphate kinase 2 (PPK2 family)
LARSTRSPDIARFQHDSSLEKSAKRFSLTRFDPSDKTVFLGRQGQGQGTGREAGARLDQLQDLFYADRRFKLLVVLQGTDTSGKDGTIRGVFGR